MEISFLGASGEVTGSKYLLKIPFGEKTTRFFVDYGMFQGGKEALSKNLEQLVLPPEAIDFVILTHAHIDHSGLLPRLCAQGFEGPIYCTPATKALLNILLLDSAHIQQADYERALRKQAQGRWKGEVSEPLYRLKDVENCLSQIRCHDYHDSFRPAAGLEVEFHNAGHILGAAIVSIKCLEESTGTVKKLVFSGDLGMFNQPMMNAPELIDGADLLLVESTYGNRLHRDLDSTKEELVSVITSTFSRGGNVVMPSFAVGRTQEILYVLAELVRTEKLPALNIWVDSPMATAVTKLTEAFSDELDQFARDSIEWQKKHIDLFNIHFVADVEESKSLNKIKQGAIILSASGMCEAGRIVHHLKNNLPHEKNSIVITGFQAQGTLGRHLVDGAPTVRIMGEDVPVMASVHTLGGLSAHADQANLLRWLKGFHQSPKAVFVVHGEVDVANIFMNVIRNQLGWSNVSVAEKNSTILL